jgi:hypothetical protein
MPSLYIYIFFKKTARILLFIKIDRKEECKLILLSRRLGKKQPMLLSTRLRVGSFLNENPEITSTEDSTATQQHRTA